MSSWVKGLHVPKDALEQLAREGTTIVPSSAPVIRSDHKEFFETYSEHEVGGYKYFAPYFLPNKDGSKNALQFLREVTDYSLINGELNKIFSYNAWPQ